MRGNAMREMVRELAGLEGTHRTGEEGSRLRTNDDKLSEKINTGPAAFLPDVTVRCSTPTTGNKTFQRPHTHNVLPAHS